MNGSLIFLIIIVALCYFETLLSTKENKYAGLIIPALTFIASIILTLKMATAFLVGRFIFTLLFVNIPTYILLLIYKLKRRNIT